MTDFLKQDIFFFITTIAVVVLTIAFAVALFYLIRILRNVDGIVDVARGETHNIVNDIAEARQGIKAKVGVAAAGLGLMASYFLRKAKKAARKSAKKDSHNT